MTFLSHVTPKNGSCSFSPSQVLMVTSSLMPQPFLVARKGAVKHGDPFRQGTIVLKDGRRLPRATIAPTKELACQTLLLHLHHGAPSRPAAFSWEESPSLTARSRQRCHPSLSARGQTGADGQADRDAPSPGCDAGSLEKDGSSPTASKVCKSRVSARIQALISPFFFLTWHSTSGGVNCKKLVCRGR